MEDLTAIFNKIIENTPVSSALAPATPPALAPEQKPGHWKPNGGPVNFKATEAPDPAKYKGFKF